MAETPESVVVFDAERPYLHDGVDLAYVDRVGGEIAAILAAGDVAEAAYQPGDGSFYGVVIVPLRSMRRAGPREKDGRAWDAHAVRDLVDADAVVDPLDGFPRPSGLDAINALPYLRDAYLVVNVENGTCQPLMMRPGETVSSDYVAERQRVSAVSAVSIAVLLRAVCHHLGAAAG